jgi:hypothetical protein
VENDMNSKVKQFIITILFGTLMCAIVGAIIFGFVIFKMNDMRAVILLYGFYGSIFYAAIKYLKLREQIAAIIFIIIVTILFRGKTIYPLFYLRDIYLLLPLFISIYLYKLFIMKYVEYPLFIRGLSLVLIFPLLYLSSFFPLMLILGINIGSVLRSLFISFRLAIIVSIGLAIGFDLYEKYKIKINSLAKVV